MPRARQVKPIRVRSQMPSIPKEKAVQVTAWVNPLVKEELEKLAEREGMSVSGVAAALLEKALQTRIDLEYSALLKPIIEQAIAREMRGISTRLAWLSVRVAFDAGQTRSLVTNILGRQPGVTPDVLKTILEGSGKTARGNIIRRTPQLTEFIEAVEQWLVTTEDKEETTHGTG